MRRIGSQAALLHTGACSVLGAALPIVNVLLSDIVDCSTVRAGFVVEEGCCSPVAGALGVAVAVAGAVVVVVVSANCWLGVGGAG